MDLDTNEAFLEYLENRYHSPVSDFFYCPETKTLFTAPEQYNYSDDWGWEYDIKAYELDQYELQEMAIELMTQIKRLKEVNK